VLSAYLIVSEREQDWHAGDSSAEPVSQWKCVKGTERFLVYDLHKHALNGLKPSRTARRRPVKRASQNLHPVCIVIERGGLRPSRGWVQTASAVPGWINGLSANCLILDTQITTKDARSRLQSCLGLVLHLLPYLTPPATPYYWWQLPVTALQGLTSAEPSDAVLRPSVCQHRSCLATLRSLPEDLYHTTRHTKSHVHHSTIRSVSSRFAETRFSKKNRTPYLQLHF